MIIRDDGRCFVARRAAHKSTPLKWEFPGGQVEDGESPQTALAREIGEELGLRIGVGPWLGRGEGRAGKEGQTRIVLDVYAAQMLGGELTLKDHDQCIWAQPQDLRGLDWSAADIPVVDVILAMLGEAQDMRALLARGEVP